jgi:hypothetical protein
MREGFLYIRRLIRIWILGHLMLGAEVDLDLKTNYVQGMYAEGKN